MNNETMRAEFEKVIGGLGYVSERCGGGYRFEEVEVAWQAWQAARAQSAEPVAHQFWCPRKEEWCWFNGEDHYRNTVNAGYTVRALYTHPPARDQVPGGLHPSVVAFAHAMQYKLDANKFKDGKGWTRNPDGSRNGWAGVSPEFLIEKLKEECEELVCEVEEGGGDLIWKEAGDVGNIAMMLADVTDALAAAPQPPAQGWRPCSKRLPTKTEAEPYNRVIAWDSEHEESVLCYRHELSERRYLTHWKPTGLKRPEPPEE